MFEYRNYNNNQQILYIGLQESEETELQDNCEEELCIGTS